MLPWRTAIHTQVLNVGVLPIGEGEGAMVMVRLASMAVVAFSSPLSTLAMAAAVSTAVGEAGLVDIAAKVAAQVVATLEEETVVVLRAGTVEVGLWEILALRWGRTKLVPVACQRWCLPNRPHMRQHCCSKPSLQ